MSNRDNGGKGPDEEGATRKQPSADPTNTTSSIVPECASHTELEYLQLEQRLKDAAEGERFSEAIKLKERMRHLLDQHMATVQARLLRETQKMKEACEAKRRTKTGKLALDIEEAVAVEDFSRAAELRAELTAELEAARESIAAWRNASMPPAVPHLLRHLDLMWMENEVLARVEHAKQAEADFRKSLDSDPKRKLEVELEEAIAAEEFDRAAAARDALLPYMEAAERSRMLAALRKSMEARRAELRRIAKDELRLLNLKLEQAVDAELFEEAKDLAGTIAELEKVRMYETLEKKVRDEGARLTLEGSGAAAAVGPVQPPSSTSISHSSSSGGGASQGEAAKSPERAATPAMTLGGAVSEMAAAPMVRDENMEFALTMFFLSLCSISTIPFFLIHKVMSDLAVSLS